MTGLGRVSPRNMVSRVLLRRVTEAQSDQSCPIRSVDRAPVCQSAISTPGHPLTPHLYNSFPFLLYSDYNNDDIVG